MKVGLFIPCYVDTLYPEVGIATYKLLRGLNLDVEYPDGRLVVDNQWRMVVSNVCLRI